MTENIYCQAIRILRWRGLPKRCPNCQYSDDCKIWLSYQKQKLGQKKIRELRKSTKTEQLCIRVTPDFLANVEILASRKGCNSSQLCRLAISRYIARR